MTRRDTFRILRHDSGGMSARAFSPMLKVTYVLELPALGMKVRVSGPWGLIPMPSWYSTGLRVRRHPLGYVAMTWDLGGNGGLK